MSDHGKNLALSDFGLGTLAAGEISMGTMSAGLVEHCLENEEHSHQDVLNPRGEEAQQSHPYRCG